MRLNSKEIKAISKGVKLTLPSIDYKLFLFGSRADDSKKGGDIDLLIIVNPNFKSTVVGLKSKIRFNILNELDEQKVDITIATELELKTDPFLISIAHSLVSI